jgi:tryptophan-rich sensory protein
MNWTLIASIALFYTILIGVNIPAPWIGLRFDRDEAPRLWYESPGFLIPVAWFLLFTLLGIGRYAVLSQGHPGLQYPLLALAVLCAAYAYYTLGLAKLTGISALWYGLAGNIAVMLCAAWVVCTLCPVPAAALLTAPVILWTAYATLIVLGQMRQKGMLTSGFGKADGAGQH